MALGAAGAQAGNVGVSLVLNGKTLDTKTVALPATGRAAVEFFLPDASYGFNKGEVRIQGSDRLPQDDVFMFALERKEPSKILFVHDARQARSAQFYRTAMDSTADAGFSIESLTPEQVAGIDAQGCCKAA